MKAGNKPKDFPILSFGRQVDWRAWLDENHSASPGVWLKIAKKSSSIKSIDYPQALEEALCYGWIDGQKKGFDDAAWLQKFTPRGPKSIWSKINREKAEQFIKSGKMKPSGLKAIESAKQDGRWQTAYDSFRTIQVPSDLQAELDKHPKAKAFFARLDATNRYAILHRTQTAKKPETRLKRIKQFIEMLEKHEKIYP